jgi:DNA polymerase III subunit delta
LTPAPLHDVADLIRDCRAGKIPAVCFLFGEETWWMDAAVRTFREAVVTPETRDFNYDLLQAEETDGESVVRIAASFPLMAERRLVVVKSIQKFTPHDKKRILAYVQAPLASTCLILTAAEADRRQTFYSELTALAVSAECKPLYENQAVEWVERAVRGRKRGIQPEAAALLVQQTGTALWPLTHEIEKLITYAGDKTGLELADVEAVTGFSRRYNTWDFADAVAGRDLERALAVLRKLLRERSSGPALIMDLHRRVLLLTRVRALQSGRAGTGAIASALKVKPYFAELYARQARGFSLAELRRANRTLLEADAHIKTGRLAAEPALTLAVYDLVRGRPGRRYFGAEAA